MRGDHYPDKHGHLVACGLGHGQVTSREAHRGGFLTAVVSGSGLLTIGRADGQLKIWRADHDTSVETLEAPVGVVSGAVLTDAPLRLLLISDGGQAGVYRREANTLQRERRLDGQDFRVARSLSPRARERLQEQQRLAAARRIRSRIVEMIDGNDPGDMEELHAELIELGFKEVSLALRARYASARNDLIAELEACHRLTSILSKQDRRALRSWWHYAAVLERTWRIDEALEVYALLSTMAEPSERFEYLAPYAEILEGTEWIIEPDIAMPLAARAAAVVGKPFVGRWLVRTLEPVPFSQGHVTVDMIAARYERVRLESTSHDLPPAKTETLTWLSREGVRQAETMTVGHPLDDEHGGQQIAVQVMHDGIQSVVVPFILLNAGGTGPSSSVEQHNSRALGACEHVEKDGLAGSWQRRVLHFILLTLQRLLTEAAAEPDGQKGT